MSVLYGFDELPAGDGPPWACSRCDDPIAVPAVQWWLPVGRLVLHASCARALGAHLIADSREAELGGSPEPHWRRRAIAAVRHRLETEEVAAA